jgi:Flp pilus assembly protein TadD
MAQCPTCGRDIEAGINFCPACGASVHSPAVAAMIQDALKVLSQKPEDASARYNLAIAYKLAGSDEMAMGEFSKVAQLQPDFADAYYEMGALHAKHGRRSEAAAALTRAQELEPQNARIARLLERLGHTG